MLENLFNNDKKILNKIAKICEPIKYIEEQLSNITDEELRNKTQLFRDRLNSGETLDDILPEAFAVVGEATYRVCGFRLHFNQYETAVVMHMGDCAELQTGQGKSNAAVIAAYLEALAGKGVHIITVNEYLAERDAVELGKIFNLLGMSVGINKSGMNNLQKREAYACDVTYTTNSELGFDYLRDNMVTVKKDRVLRDLNFAIVDEADSILIDDSRTPLIISGKAKKTKALYETADKFVKSLLPEDYEINEEDKHASLQDSGITKAEKYFNLDNLYDQTNIQLVHAINQSIHANLIFKRDVDYTVENDEVCIIDPNTGRKMEGREWNNGLHQAVQAKEGVKIKEEQTIVATITYQNFFRLFNKVAGMTGTAKTEEEEFLEVYNMRVVCIPPNTPVIRVDKPDCIYVNNKYKYKAIIEKIKELHAKGQPVLLGTVAVRTSEILSKMLTREGIKHEVLNAKNHAREAEIIAKAGQKGAVTIATNMAGRGTDIKIDDEVKTLGGLAVIGSERHESRRIDNQLRGRSGRQGDPGESQFYVSLEDDLMIRFGMDRVEGIMNLVEDSPIESKIVTRALNSAQKRAEGLNFDVRKNLMEYDNVNSEQRNIIYEIRNNILDVSDMDSIVKDIITPPLLEYLDNELSGKNPDYENIVKKLEQIGLKLKVEELKRCNKEQLITVLPQLFMGYVHIKLEPVNSIGQVILKNSILGCIDTYWMSHLETLDQLKQGIGLRGYGHNDPKNEYRIEAVELFNSMMDSIRQDLFVYLCKLNIKVEPQKQEEVEAD